VTQAVLNLNPWYSPRYVIPLAGMIFASSMNSVSLAVERLTAEMERNVDYQQARNTALRTSLIPITNSLFAVGLVSLPGMMTGQILSGISPLVAARYGYVHDIRFCRHFFRLISKTGQAGFSDAWED